MDPTCQALLLELAGASIRHGLATGKPLQVDLQALPPECSERRATFVTLKRHGELRGCVGCLKALRPLAQDIALQAYSAAFLDSRFPPVRAGELEGLSIALSLLTPPEPLSFVSEADLIAQLRPGVDGLILERGLDRGTFLPSVWQSLPEPREFLRQLRLKAGLPALHPLERVKAFRYTVEAIG
jgi:hypothetical protein